MLNVGCSNARSDKSSGDCGKQAVTARKLHAVAEQFTRAVQRPEKLGRRQFELFVHELLDLREHSSISTNGMTLLRS